MRAAEYRGLLSHQHNGHTKMIPKFKTLPKMLQRVQEFNSAIYVLLGTDSLREEFVHLGTFSTFRAYPILKVFYHLGCKQKLIQVPSLCKIDGEAGSCIDT